MPIIVMVHVLIKVFDAIIKKIVLAKHAHTHTHTHTQLHDSLTKLGGTTFSIMTITPRPLRQFLHPEADRLGLTLEQYLDHYLDLGKELRITFPSAPVTDDLDKMAECILSIPEHFIQKC